MSEVKNQEWSNLMEDISLAYQNFRKVNRALMSEGYLGITEGYKVCESAKERGHRLNVIRNRLTRETPEQRQHRLGVINERLEQNFLLDVRK
ncbi:hypothetical protein EVAR_29720_1 [Eumeta japonica]|uniref:Uncharacterized protein n=1 Tax=Eumeta variegata TaxID=151549 RepID=A0A4C1VXJ6_EUMVA|nr:hypothetical protein EVAR_29720_1 [Eumeta japonica]